MKNQLDGKLSTFQGFIDEIYFCPNLVEFMKKILN